MLVSFIESIKYVGHLVPLSFLRIYMGYYYLQVALMQYQGDFLFRPRLAEIVAEALPRVEVSIWYKELMEQLFIQHWQTSAFVITGLEFAIAISYLLGYVVRPMAILAALMSLNVLMLLNSPADLGLHKAFLVIHLTLAWAGAGRCLGMDYYFFKRRRGLWW